MAIVKTYVKSVRFSYLTKEGYRDHLLRLDKDSKYFRFGGAISDDAIVSFVDKVWSPNDTKYSHHVVGLFPNDEPYAVGHFHVALNGKAEVSLGLEKQFRGRGLGKLILSSAFDTVSSYGYDEFTMDCLSRNQKIVKLIQSLRGEVIYEASGSEIRARVKII